MLKIVSSICAAAVALSVPLATPAAAMPKADPAWSASAEHIVKVGHIDWHRRAVEPNWLQHSRRIYQDDDREYWRGERRHRNYRHYRHYDDDDFGIGLGGFIAGAIIGGALAQQPSVRYYGGGNAHVQWCYDRYRSYRAYDNTFQPYNGPRRQCNSPYN